MQITLSPKTRDEPKLFSCSSFCWIRDNPDGRNQFVSFEHRFLHGHEEPVLLHLFADTRYRLWVNETFVAYGPGRFVTDSPEHDSHDLTPYLLRGENLVRVEVNFYGSPSFQAMPDGRPCFIADGGSPGDRNRFATPGEWKARVHHAWDDQAPLFSFAQNPAEICDTRVLASELDSAAYLPLQPLSAKETPWSHLTPRSVPAPDYTLVRPAEVQLAAPLDQALRWGMQFIAPNLKQLEFAGTRIHTQFSSWIHSPREQTLTMDCFWSDLAINGDPIRIDYSKHYGNHGQSEIQLRKGWNFLAGHFEHLLERWAYLIGLPHDSGVSLHALPNHSCAHAFACSRPGTEAFIPECPATPQDYVLPEGWILRSGSLKKITPARLVAWDRPLESEAVRSVAYARLPEVATITSREAVWCFDFKDEFYGQVVVDVEAPAGSVLDVAYDDWKRADGCVNLYGSNPFTDAADRFFLCGGRQKIEVLNPRGGIYLQLILRAPEDSPPVALKVHDIAIRRRTLLNTIHGSFTSDDPLLDWTWRTSVRTLQASTDESYADCPWRERGSYIGDSLVNLHIHRLITSDLSIAKRTFAIFGKAQLPDGQLACCAPSWLTKPHEDFTLIWILAVRDVWACTGDTDFIAAQWEVIRRIWESPTWKPDADGLWQISGMRVFIDWGALISERSGPGNLVVNVLRVAAARATSEIANALGLADEAARFANEATQVSEALCALLWNEAEGRFDASIGAKTSAIHGNILALRYGVGPGRRILSYLEPALRGNLQYGMGKGQNSGFAELYFFYYLLPALVEHERTDLAELLIREHYGFIQSLGLPTLPECFHRANVGGGSCCHSWSGAPAIYATESVLGLKQAFPGKPDLWKLDPRSTTHSHAEGSVPHPRGLIRVRWKRHGDRIEARVSAPSGVTILPAEHVEILSNPSLVPARQLSA
jgi:alpha-L-rhamnosidase